MSIRKPKGTSSDLTVTGEWAIVLECMIKLRKNVLLTSFRRFIKSTIKLCLTLQYPCKRLIYSSTIIQYIWRCKLDCGMVSLILPLRNKWYGLCSYTLVRKLCKTVLRAIAIDYRCTDQSLDPRWGRSISVHSRCARSTTPHHRRPLAAGLG